MSEENGYATIVGLQQHRGKRRFKNFDWPRVGTVVLQSAMAGEWVKIDAARQRATMAAMAGKVKEHERATEDFLLQICLCLVVDQAHAPFFSLGDKDLILSLDSALTDSLATACIEHCGLDEANMGAAQKNLPATSGGSSLTGSQTASVGST